MAMSISLCSVSSPLEYEPNRMMASGLPYFSIKWIRRPLLESWCKLKERLSEMNGCSLLALSKVRLVSDGFSISTRCSLRRGGRALLIPAGERERVRARERRWMMRVG